MQFQGVQFGSLRFIIIRGIYLNERRNNKISGNGCDSAYCAEFYFVRI